MRNSRKSARALAAVALTTAVTGIGIGVGAPAASAATITTPIWGMQCTTWTAGSHGAYYGYARCTGLGKWRVNVSCTVGLNYNSLWQHTYPDQTLTARAGSCYWGVSSVTISEKSS
jgi:hypothetical protein